MMDPMTMPRRTVALLATALLALAPTLASATWGIQGSLEPDTPQDREGFMWSGPDRDPNPAVRQVYFNAMALSGVTPAPNTGGYTINANVVPGARLAPPGGVTFVALLGIWKDCDDDGYVGSAGGELWRYRAELLADSSICPPGTAHNRDGWVWEFLQISNPPTYNSPPLYGIVDRDARVWGDFGTPGAIPRYTCETKGFPPGGLSSSAPLIDVVDCHLGGQLAASAQLLDPDGSRGLSFGDAGPECGDVLRVEYRLWRADACSGAPGRYQRDSGRPAFYVWDCSDPRETAVRDPTAESGRGALSGYGRTNWTNNDGEILRFPTPAPRVGDPDGSWNDGVWELERGVGALQSHEKCDPPSRAGLADGASLVEAGRVNDPTLGKRRTDFVMRHLSHDWAPSSAEVYAIGGVKAYETLTVYRMTFGAGWSSREEVSYEAPGYKSGLLRDDLAPEDAIWFTFYAKVGMATERVVLSPFGTGTYGAEACGTENSGVHGGWDCDAANWWRADLGGSPKPIWVDPSRVGHSYHYRDVDCYDGTLFTGGPRATLAVEQTGCPAP